MVLSIVRRVKVALRPLPHVLWAVFGFAYDCSRFVRHGGWRGRCASRKRDYKAVKIYHRMEKSLSFRQRRANSGWAPANDLVQLLDRDGVDAATFCYQATVGIKVLHDFVACSDGDGATARHVNDFLEKTRLASVEGRVVELATAQRLAGGLDDPERFFLSRHSVRDFRPEAVARGVRLVRVCLPRQGRYWVQLQRLPFPRCRGRADRFPYPRGSVRILPAWTPCWRWEVNYSLDCRIPSPTMAVDRFAMDMRKPVILWGGSVGPFDRVPALVAPMTWHLSRMHHVGARESVSYDYLTGKLGLRNVIRMADPAFVLAPEPVDTDAFWPTGSGRVLGLNVSESIERYRRPGQDLRAEVGDFIRHVVTAHGMSVLLVPHVYPLTDGGSGGDSPDVSAASLLEALERLLRGESALHSTLTRWVGELQTMARSAAARISEQLVNRLKMLTGADAMQVSRTS